MAGLPRSGGTMLSAILNQNPEIFVSPHSILPGVIGDTYLRYQSDENMDSNQSQSPNIYNVLEEIIPLFYKGNKERFIIDKNFSWTEPHPYAILRHHLKNPIKIICPVRNILDILASWNRLCENDKKNKYDLEIMKDDRTRRPMADKRADYFMKVGGSDDGIMANLDGMKHVAQFSTSDLMLIDYDDLTSDINRVVEGVYNFLGIDHYNHNFDNIKNPHTFTDSWGVKDHHVVRPVVQRREYDIDQIFSPSTIKKYSGLEFWK